MPVQMKAELKGLKAVQQALRKMKASLTDYSKLFMRETIVLQGIFSRRFASQNKGKWKPLNPVTIALSKPHKPLNLTGGLKGSLGGRNSFSLRDIQRDRMMYGTTHKMAAVHDKGKKIKVTDAMRNFFAANMLFLRKEKKVITIPKRAFMFLEQEDKQKIGIVWKMWADEIVSVRAGVSK